MSLDTVLSLLFLVFFIGLPVVSRILRDRNRRSTGRAGTGGAPPSGRGAAPAQPPDQADVPPWLAEAQRRVREASEGTAVEASTRPADETTGQAGTPNMGHLFGPAESSPAEQPAAGYPAAEPASVPGEASTQRQGPPLVPEDPFGGGLMGRQGEQRADQGLGREGVPPPQAPAPTSMPVKPSPARREGARSPEPAPGTRRRRKRVRLARAEAHLEAEAEALVEAIAAYARPPGRAVGARLDVVGLLRFDREAIVSGLIWHEILDEPAWKRRRWRVPSRPRSR